MALVEVNIRNHTYTIACNDSEVSQLKMVAESFKKKVDTIANGLAQASDDFIMLIAALSAEEELLELRKKHGQLPLFCNDTDIILSKKLDDISDRIENLTKNS